MKEIVLKDMPLLDEASCRFHILPDGSMVDVYAVRYDSKVDIVNKKYIDIFDSNYKKCTLPTLNDLYAEGVLDKEGTCIEKQYNIYFPEDKTLLTTSDINTMIKEFKDNGLNVTKEAIMHNYQAWRFDQKSGYRDEDNGYHLFTPCGCNPMSFRASSLHTKCEDWQQTYTC